MFNMQDFLRTQGTGMQVVNAGEFAAAADPGVYRPYLGDDGKIYVDKTVDFKPRYDANGNYVLNTGKPIYDRVVEPMLMYDLVRHGMEVTEVTNASVLRKEQWVALDTKLGLAVRKRLKAYADLRALSTNTVNGYSLGTLEREIMSDNGEALVSMDGLAEGRNSQSTIGLESLPLPITYSNFWLSKRFLEISRNKGQGMDVYRGEQAGRRCGELVEQTTIGTVAGIQWGTPVYSTLNTSKVYGYTNHPNRITYTSLTSSATIVTNLASTGPKSFFNNVSALIDAAVAQNFFGPYMLYLSGAYYDIMRQDYLISGNLGNKTIEQRIRELPQIKDIRRLDYLTGDVMILIQFDSEYLEAVNGMEFTPIQYSTKGGEQVNFKLMGIQVPRIMPVYVSDVGSAPSAKAPIVHGTTS